MVKTSDLKKENANNLISDEIDTINIVLRDYGNMSPYELRELTHSEEPYIKAHGGLADGVPCDNIIPKSYMGDFYGSL